MKKGGSVSPVELANIAGVDITEQPLKSTIQYISDLVDEVEKLTDEIEQANNQDARTIYRYNINEYFQHHALILIFLCYGDRSYTSSEVHS